MIKIEWWRWTDDHHNKNDHCQENPTITTTTIRNTANPTSFEEGIQFHDDDENENENDDEVQKTTFRISSTSIIIIVISIDATRSNIVSNKK